MRETFEPLVERSRVITGHMASPVGASYGAFSLPGPLGMTLNVMVSAGHDWTESGLEGEPWEHVSVSTQRRTPTWRELEWVRELFFKPEELVLQLSVPRSKHISLHDNCLHLWRPTKTVIPMPPGVCV